MPNVAQYLDNKHDIETYYVIPTLYIAYLYFYT